MSDIDADALRNVQSEDDLTDETRPYFEQQELEDDESYADAGAMLGDEPDQYYA